MCPVRLVTYVSGRSNKTGHAQGIRFYVRARDRRQGTEQIALGSFDADLLVRNLDLLRQQPEVVAAVAAPIGSHPFQAVLANWRSHLQIAEPPLEQIDLGLADAGTRKPSNTDWACVQKYPTLAGFSLSRAVP